MPPFPHRRTPGGPAALLDAAEAELARRQAEAAVQGGSAPTVTQAVTPPVTEPVTPKGPPSLHAVHRVFVRTFCATWDAIAAAKAAGVSPENAGEKAAEYLDRKDVQLELRRLIPAFPPSRGMVLYLARDVLRRATGALEAQVVTRLADYVGLDGGGADQEQPLDLGQVAADVAMLIQAGLDPLAAPVLDRRGVPEAPVVNVGAIRAIMEGKEPEAPAAPVSTPQPEPETDEDVPW